MILTFTHISKPEYKGKPVYVLNKTKGTNRGPVTFTCPKSNGGGVDSVFVQDTWIPVNLIEQMPWERLIDSMGFRRAVAAKVLVIVDEQEALQMLSSDGADEEINRINAMHGIDGDDEEVAVSEGNLDLASAKVISLLGKVEEQGETSVINSFRTIREELNNGNLKEIFTFAKQHGYKQLMKWAKEQRD